MLPEKIIKDRFWLLLAIGILVVVWSLPMVSLAIDAESREVFSRIFALGWSGLLVVGGFLLYRVARNNPQTASVVIVLALASLAMLYRIPWRFLTPEFTAEDGCIFYVQQRDLGVGAFFEVFASYYHTLIRLVAASVALFPTLFAPALYSLAWLGIYSLVVTYILVQYPNRKLAPIVALVTAFVPHTLEVFMNLTNVIWIVGLGLTAFVLLPVPDLKRVYRYLLALILLVFSLTGPFSIILSPFYILRWVVNRKSISLLYVIAVILGAIIQYAALHSAKAVHVSTGLPDVGSLGLCIKIAIQRVPWSLGVGYVPEDPYWLIGLVLTLVLLGYVTREIARDFKRQIFPLGCLVLCGAYVGSDLLRLGMANIYYLANGWSGDRYFYIPKVLFFWALIHLASTVRNPKPFYVALVFCVMGSFVQFSCPQTVIDNHWPRYAVLIDQGQPVSVPINPPGWTASVNTASPRK